MRFKHIISGILFMLSIGSHAMGQIGDAGVESPFSAGVGARSLGLGNAMVAFPDDPSAFFWNPAGMVVVEQRGVDVSMATYFEGTQYNFIGYVHPTMTIGVLGLGITRIGTDDIVERSWENGRPEPIGVMDYWWGKLTLSYARTLFRGFSMGINFDVHRQVLGSNSANGFDVDFGIHYAVPAQSGFFKQFYFGCSMANPFSSRLKLGSTSEAIPYNIRAGLAKAFVMRDNSRLLFLADVEQGENRNLQYHFGGEYGWKRRVFLRLGVDNGQMTFGGGIRLGNLQIDYGTSPLSSEGMLPWGHRFSLAFFIGKKMPEQRRLLEEERQREIQVRIDDAQETERQKLIREGLQAGQDFLDKQDYFNARLEISRVLRADEDNVKAKELLGIITERETDYQRKRENEILRQDRETGQRQRDIAFINQRLAEGNKASLEEDFKKAIEKWQEALEKDPSNTQIQNYIQQARGELTNEVNQRIARSEQLVRQGKSSDAYKVLEEAKDQSEGYQELHNKVLRKINELDRNIDFINNYNTGIQHYNNRQYESAANAFKEALKYNPNHAKTKELYRNSSTRSGGKKGEMTGEVLNKYNTGSELYIKGLYQEALVKFEEALELDPNNVIILDAIEGVKKKIEIYEKKE
jgi:tetratricopeptide (TPR) repeat protein